MKKKRLCGTRIRLDHFSDAKKGCRGLQIMGGWGQFQKVPGSGLGKTVSIRMPGRKGSAISVYQ